MATCQNGWPAIPTADGTAVYQIGQTVKVRLAPGAPGELLAHFARWFDANVRDVDPGILDDWGWAYRNVSGSTDLSNHAGGYAIDLNATQWPLGSAASRYLTADEIARVHAQLALYEGTLRWGADYVGRTDPMHVEVIGSPADVERVWAKISAPPAPVIPPCPGLPAWSLPRGHYYGLITGPAKSHGGFYSSERPAIQAIQRRLIAKGYVPGIGDWRSGWADGLFQQPTVDAVARFQRAEMPSTTYYGQVWADDYRRLAQ